MRCDSTFVLGILALAAVVICTGCELIEQPPGPHDYGSGEYGSGGYGWGGHGQGGQRPEQDRLTLDLLPPATRNAILRIARGAPVERLVTGERGGQVTYIVEFFRDDRRVRLEVDSFGRVLAEDVDIVKNVRLPMDEIPMAARQAIRRVAQGAAVDFVVTGEKNREVTYIAEFDRGGRRVKLEVDRNGQVIDQDVRGGKLTLELLPPGARQTILREARGSAIESLKADEKSSGAIYVAVFVRDSRIVTLSVDSFGRIVREDAQVRKGVRMTLDQVPVAARNAILRVAQGAAVGGVVTGEKSGDVTYIAEFARGAKRVKLTVDGAGRILDQDVSSGKLTLDLLPAAARDTIVRVSKGAAIEKLEAREKTGGVVYVADFVRDGKKVTLSVDFAGGVVNEEVHGKKK